MEEEADCVNVTAVELSKKVMPQAHNPLSLPRPPKSRSRSQTLANDKAGIWVKFKRPALALP